jgi:XTP/dITP diphosphohydrolase
MKQLVFATNNRHKAAEVAHMLDGTYDIKTLVDIGCLEEIPETSNTLEGNALLKAEFVKKKFGLDCFADDTGLEVEVLAGEPGVYSARYAGPNCTPADNINKLLDQMKDAENRAARFRTSICLILDGKTSYFEGTVEGDICSALSGTEGFGYDPVFQPAGYENTFAEMSKDEKNRISHRGIAVRQLVEHLRNSGVD